MSVSRETLERLARRYELPAEAPEKLSALLAALAAEADPPTTVRDPVRAVDEHVADGLAGLEVPELRRARQIVDIGSGAGFPGLTLAAALPGAQVDLVESARRKCELIERLAATAGIGNATAIPARAEERAAGDGRSAYDAATVRAVDSLPVLAEYAAPLLREGGVLVAWKGTRDASEEEAGDAAAAEVGLGPGRAIPVQPFEGARSRHLHVFVKEGPTPDRFPRRPGMARKRPLA